MGEITKIGHRQKQLQGHGRFIKNVPEVKPISKMWPTPADLGTAGKSLWETQGPILVKAKVLTELDEPLFTLLCKSLDFVDLADKTLATEGMTITCRDGAKAHPAVKARHDASMNFIHLSGKFGMTPYDRNKLDLRVDSQPDDKMRRFLFGKNK